MNVNDMLNEAEQLFREGEHDAGLMHAAAALAELEAAAEGDPKLLIRALRNVARGHLDLSRLDAAATHLDRALKLLGDGGDDTLLADTLHMRAVVHLHAQRLADAMPLLERAAKIFEAAGESRSEKCAVLITMAEVAQDIGELGAADGLFRRVLNENGGVKPESEAHALVINALSGRALFGLGSVAARRGEVDAAKDLLARSIEFFDAAYGHGHPEMIAALTEVAAIYRFVGDETAAQGIEEELAVAQRMLADAEASALELN